MAKNVSKHLKGAQELWKKAKKRIEETRGETGFKEFDDGKYLARLIAGDIGESQAGRTQVAWQYQFAEGEYEGDVKYAYEGLETEDNLYYLGKNLEKLGYVMPDSIDELKGILKDIAKNKPLCRIALRTKGEFQNVWLNQVFDKDDEPELEAGDDEEPEEETEEAGDEEEAEEETGGDEEEEEEEEEAEEEEEEDDAELSVGTIVMATTKDGDQKGEVIEIVEAEGKARVRIEKTGKIVKLAYDRLVLFVPEEPVKAKKVKADKPANAIAKKKL